MTAAKRLAGYVHVGGQVYGPGSDVPPEVAEQITNPAAWRESVEPDEPEKKAPAKKAASSSTKQ